MASTSEKLELKIVGTRPIRPDGVDKVMGRANFGGGGEGLAVGLDGLRHSHGLLPRYI